MPTDSDSPEIRARLARSVLKNNLRLRAGERVIIEAWTHTLPWAVAFAREARRMGAYPLIPYDDEAAYWDAVEDREFDVLGKAAAHEWGALARTDVYLHMWGPGDRVRMGALPRKVSQRLFAYNEEWYSVARKAGVRGARLELGRPYPTLSEAYGVDIPTWTEQLVQGTMVSPDQLARSAARVTQTLARGRKLRIRNDDGTDLTLELAGRAPRTYIGRPVTGDRKRPYDILANIPSGAVRVALDENVAEGLIVANRTCYYEDGKATGAVFRFHDGKLTSADFDRGGDRFQKSFKTAGKGRDRPGFLAIGLNPALHDTPQLEDIERGAILVSVGGNQYLGGKNTSSFFGWAINAGGTVEVDGRKLSLGV